MRYAILTKLCPRWDTFLDIFGINVGDLCENIRRQRYTACQLTWHVAVVAEVPSTYAPALGLIWPTHLHTSNCEQAISP